jgi:Zn-dependent protease
LACCFLAEVGLLFPARSNSGASSGTLVSVQGGLDFAIAGVPVRVLPTFFLMAALLGWGLQDILLIVLWVVIVFVSVLLHELGHAFMYRRAGSDASIVLHSFGGLTFGKSLPVRRDLAVSLAGPGINLLVGVPLVALAYSGVVTGSTAESVLAMAIWVNVGWAILNLLPILPLDGGHALVSMLTIVAKRDATRAVNVISVVVGVVGAVLAIRYGMYFAAALAGVFVFLNVRALGQRTPWKVVRPARSPKQAVVHSASEPSNPALPPSQPPPPSSAPPLSRPVPVTPPAAPSLAPPGSPPAATESPRQRPAIPGRRSLDEEVGSAIKAVLASEPELALIAVDRVRGHGLTDEQAARADELEAWAWLQRGEPDAADPVIARLPADDPARRYLEAGLSLVSGAAADDLDALADADPSSLSGRFLATLVTAG